MIEHYTFFPSGKQEFLSLNSFLFVNINSFLGNRVFYSRITKLNCYYQFNRSFHQAECKQIIIKIEISYLR